MGLSSSRSAGSHFRKDYFRCRAHFFEVIDLRIKAAEEVFLYRFLSLL